MQPVPRALHQAARRLGRSPGFTLLAITVMALGIDANTTLFTLVQSVLLDPLPYPNAHQLVMLYQHDPAAKDQNNYVAAGNFADWQRASTGFTAMAMVSPWAAHDLEGDGHAPAEKVATAWCSGNMFSILGAQPAYGRVLSDADDRPEANPAVVLSWGIWQRRFGGKSSTVGQIIRLNGKPYAVVGIMPRNFDFPVPRIDLWTAAHNEGSAKLLSSRDDHEFQVIARLKPGVSLTQAVAELSAVQRHIRLANPGLPIEPEVSGRPLLEDLVGSAATPLYTMLAATTCLLLVASLNVAALLIARSAGRQREQAIRIVLGGRQRHLVVETLAESLLLAAGGGACGVGIALASVRWLQATHPGLLPRMESAALNPPVLAFVLLTTVITGVIAGLVPLWKGRDRRMLAALQESTRSMTAGTGRVRLQKGLLASEIALTAGLLVVMGMLIKSYESLRSTDLGCRISHIITMQVTLSNGRYKDPASRVLYWSQLTEKARALPQVECAGLVTVPPGGGWWEDAAVSVVERPATVTGTVLDPIARTADTQYFTTMGIPLLRGRTFSSADSGSNSSVVILSAKAAVQFFPGENPIGNHLRLLQDAKGPALEVVGVVGDTRFQVTEDIWPTIYQPIASGKFTQATLVVRTSGDPRSLVHPLQNIAAGLDRTLPVAEPVTMDEIIADATRSAGFDSTLVQIFAALALILACAGIYGTQAFLVTQRTSEIGIRMALGASRRGMVRLVLRQSTVPVLAGTLVGLIGGWLSLRVIRAMLYGAAEFDLRIFVAATLVLVLAAAAASLAPALRAARLNPIETLRKV